MIEIKRINKVTKRKKNLIVHIIAGPNGSGKTTFAKKYLPKFAKCKEFVNADLLAAGLSPFSPETAAIKAGRLMLERIDQLQRKRVEFAFETTLSGRTYVNLIESLKESGYQINLYFLWMPSFEACAARVADRVKQGGHNIPRAVIKRRFQSGLNNLFGLHRPLLDRWMLFDASNSPNLVARGEKDKLELINKVIYNHIIEDIKK